MLDADELKRRLEAARILRGLTQSELAAQLAADGLGKHDLGRIERGNMVMQRIHREAFVRHLQLPERWFTEPDVDVIVGLKQPDGLDAQVTRSLLERLLTDLDRVEGREVPGTQTRPGDADRSGSGAADAGT